MKRLTAFIILIIFVLSFTCVSVSAEFNNPALVLPDEIVSASRTHTPKDVERLSQKLELIRERYNCDVAVYFTFKGDETKASATDDAYAIIAEKKYGIGENEDLLFFYFSLKPPRFGLVSSGIGQKAYGNEVLEGLKNELFTPMKEKNYLDAVELFITRADEGLSAVTGIEKVGDLPQEPEEVEEVEEVEEPQFKNAPIFDGAGYLSEADFNRLSEQLEGIRQKYGFDVAIHTVDSIPGNSSVENRAVFIFDSCEYGSKVGRNGIILFISKSSREYCIDVHGTYGNKAFNKNGLMYLENKVVPHLKENNYLKAFETYVYHVDELLGMAAKGEPFNETQYETSTLITIIVILLLLPLLVAYGMMKLKLRKMKTVAAQNYASNYIKDGSFNVEVDKDIFLYSHTTRTRIERNDSSGGGGRSGGHSSRSGRF